MNRPNLGIHYLRVAVGRAKVVALALLCIAGCSDNSYQFAPVSGVVTLNGEPLANARVIFLPKAPPKQLNAGPRSMGETDNEGRYRLTTTDGIEGAVVGTHRVRITTYRDKVDEEREAVKILSVEHVPFKYNHKTTLTSVVTPDGLDDCDFDLESQGGNLNQ